MPLEDSYNSLRDWRKALKNPPAYRVVNRTLRNQTKFITIIAVTGLLILVFSYAFPKNTAASVHRYIFSRSYNHTYPLSVPVINNNVYTFRIGVISDLDKNSKSNSEKNIWNAYFKKGYLSYNVIENTVTITWDKNEALCLQSSFSHRGRGMELSELIVFDGKLLSFCDRTGIVYEIENNMVYPWLILMDGDGRTAKGYKAEWASVKNEFLFVGSMGKEWTSDSGEFSTNDPQWIKMISHSGEVMHINWIDAFKRIRRAIDIEWPGYMVHESGVWSNIHQKWFFLPRRCSKHSYNDTLDEHRSCSYLITADEFFNDIKAKKLPNHVPTKGFSSFKFIPGTEDKVIVALKTEEVDGKTATYISAFTIDGKYLLNDSFFANMKYEGIEFI